MNWEVEGASWTSRVSYVKHGEISDTLIAFALLPQLPIFPFFSVVPCGPEEEENSFAILEMQVGRNESMHTPAYTKGAGGQTAPR